MKSTQKFLCYSLALVGAALIFSAGCKKGDTIAGPTYNKTQVPTLFFQQPQQVTIVGGVTTVTSAAALSFTSAGAQDGVATFGASTPTTGFYVYAWGVTTTTNPVTLTWGTAVDPIAIGAASATAAGSYFSAALSTTASFAALSPCLSAAQGGTGTGAGTITWVIQSYARNTVDIVKSALSITIVTLN